ncbi:hypothetical protein [Halobacillus sp. Cin3]|uniref:hypothetical protein n=1 Tax=Halobacillus sp. Cin3 TaxID=2928441 RepID=UPI00248D7A67|nr:hypothetical protein [Halobacillus sp. Cin3]
MAQVHKFEFQSAKKEIEVAGKNYEIDFSDEAIQRYTEMAEDAKQEYEKQQEKLDQTDELTSEDIKQIQAAQKGVVKRTLEGYLGEGSFEELYEKAGRSTVNLMDLARFLSDLFHQEQQERVQKHKDKYLANKTVKKRK